MESDSSAEGDIRPSSACSNGSSAEDDINLNSACSNGSSAEDNARPNSACSNESSAKGNIRRNSVCSNESYAEDDIRPNSACSNESSTKGNIRRNSACSNGSYVEDDIRPNSACSNGSSAEGDIRPNSACSNGSSAEGDIRPNSVCSNGSSAEGDIRPNSVCSNGSSAEGDVRPSSVCSNGSTVEGDVRPNSACSNRSSIEGNVRPNSVCSNGSSIENDVRPNSVCSNGSSVEGDVRPNSACSNGSVEVDLHSGSIASNNSICSETRSDIASSLDSVSPNQFDLDEPVITGFINEPMILDEKEKVSDAKKAIIDFADDLSDVSDIESNDSFGGNTDNILKQEKEEEIVEEKQDVEINNDKQLEDTVSLHVEGEEQLDFEAEEGECSPKTDSKKSNKEIEEPKPEKEHSDLEEGELTDDNETKPEETERPICRFFSRGHCTWGSNCRFIHPGVMDKGNYSMFETVRPVVTPGGGLPPNNAAPMMYPVFPPHIGHPHIPADRLPPGNNIRKDESVTESAWERGLRQAKELIRKSSKRKETEVDFEDKKMNLTLGQDEIDKENDYYSRHSNSPTKSPSGEKWKNDNEIKPHRGETYTNDLPPSVPHANHDIPPVGYYPPIHHGISRPDYWNHHRMGGLTYDDYALRAPHLPYGHPEYYSAAAGRRFMHPNSYYPRPNSIPNPHHSEFYDRKQKHKQYPGSSREVIVQKNDKPYKDESPSRYRNRREESPRIERARDDEWADPWMRTKSPAIGRRRRRKDAYSSGSSYSSSSESSRSSSKSSFSSKSRHSRSRSKAASSASHSQSHSSSRSASESQNRRKPPMQFKLSPSSRAQLPTPKKAPKSVSPSVLLERRAATERAMLMNPPPPSPKIKTRPHSPPVSAVITSLTSSSMSPSRNKGGLPQRLLAHSKAAVVAAMRSARSSDSKSSKSSSGSSSSDSSSDSSDSSVSSSSSSKSSKTPPIRNQKRIIPDDHIALSQAVKPKAMDALKLSGQKQQIKLTLKGTGNAQSKHALTALDSVDNRKDRKIMSSTKKRVSKSSDSESDSDLASPAKKVVKTNQKKGTLSRREELLKQLQAVEDAIARKRSKIS